MSPAAPLEMSPSDKLLGHAAAEAHGDLVQHPLHRLGEHVLLRDEHRAAEAAPARDDRHLVDGHVAVVQDALDQRVAGLVVGRELLLVVVHQAAALAAELDLLAGVLDVGGLDLLAVAAGGEERRLVQEVGELGAGKPGCPARDDAEVDVVGQVELARVDAQDLLAADHVGKVHVDLAVEAARPQERAVEDVRAVGGGDDDDALGRVEAVHLDQERVERLLALVVAAAQARAALAADGVDLVDEDEARGALAALLEHVAHARGADADEHLDEVGARDAEEGHVGLARDGLGEEGLARSRRARP